MAMLNLHPLTKSLAPLEYPIYFVHRNLNNFPELAQAKNGLPLDLLSTFRKCSSGDDILAIETYIFLKQYGLNVHLVPRVLPNKICVVPYDSLSIKDLPYRSYVVACRTDSARPEICNQQTVINKLCIKKRGDYFLMQWPQVSLLPRDLSRGNRLENLAFKGTLDNLDQDFRSADFIERLHNIGITLQIAPSIPREQLVNYWCDYSTVDAVIAIRRMPRHRFEVKPPVKLLNAWFAGCPALLGPEPAYRDLHLSDLDYFEIRSADDVINALQTLKENPKLYSAMVENGFERAKAYTIDNLCKEWRDFLAGPVTDGYKKWLNQSIGQKVFGRPVNFVFQSIHHKMNYHFSYSNETEVYGFD